MQSYWKLKGHNYRGKSKRGYTASIVIHLCFIFVIWMLSNASFLNLGDKIVLPQNPSDLIIEVVTNHTFVKEDQKEEKIKDIKPKLEFKVPEDKGAEITIPTFTTKKSTKKKIVKKNPEINRYEQLLSKHFAQALPDLPKKIKINSDIDVWLKINKSGEIFDFGFRPKPKDKKLLQILNKAIVSANPVPSPPKESFTSESVQYLIPVLFSNAS